MNRAIDIRKMTILLGVFLNLKTTVINGKPYTHVLHKESLFFLLLQREITVIDVTNLYENYLKTSTAVGRNCHHKERKNAKVIILNRKNDNENKKIKTCTYHQNLKNICQ